MKYNFYSVDNIFQKKPKNDNKIIIIHWCFYRYINDGNNISIKTIKTISYKIRNTSSNKDRLFIMNLVYLNWNNI